MPDQAYNRRRKRRFDDDDAPAFAKRDFHRRRLAPDDALDAVDGLPDGDRWSTWDQSSPTDRGPLPYPGWLVTDLGATDTELGILKTGKEADVFLIRRAVPDTGRSCLLAAKRYRAAENRLFHRDVEYLDGRRVRESRDNRAMAKRTATGRAIIAQQWARAELAALTQLHQADVPVPYPVQVTGTELLLEFIGEPDGTAAPRLAEIRPRGAELASLWDQLVWAPAAHGKPGARARRPVRLQRARAPRPRRADRPAPGDRRHRASEGGRIPRQGRREHREVVQRARARGHRHTSRRTASAAARRGADLGGMAEAGGPEKR